jgi:hypothetical protein
MPNAHATILIARVRLYVYIRQATSKFLLWYGKKHVTEQMHRACVAHTLAALDREENVRT